MNETQSTDTLVVTIYNPYYEDNDNQIAQWYINNQISQYKTKDKNHNIYHQLSINGTNVARAYHRPNIIGMNQYQINTTYVQGTLTLSFAGIKSYHADRDNLYQQTINSLLHLLQENNIAFKVIRLDIAKDILSKFNHIVGMRTNKVGLHHGLNSPLNSDFNTTFYLETYAKKSTLKALIYDKTEKEKQKKNIIDNGISRIEVSIRTTKAQFKAINSKEEYISHIQKQLNKYMFINVSNEDQANELKQDYDFMIRNKITKPSKIFMDKVKVFKGVVLSNDLSSDTVEFLELCYCDNFNAKLKASYTTLNISFNNAIIERKSRLKKKSKPLMPRVAKQQQRFKRALTKRWDNIKAVEAKPKIKVSLDMFKGFKNSSIFQYPTNNLL